MKKLIIILMVLIPLFGIGQKVNEKRAMNERRLDLTKEYLFFDIAGMIEINGHIFKNDTCKSPIIFKADLDGVSIIDTLQNIKYTHRKCDKKGCNIIHLVKIEELNESHFYPIWNQKIPNLKWNINDTLTYSY